MTDDFLDGIRTWLGKSGHTLELRTARALRRGGAGPVRLSFPYTDTATGVLREGDVLASFGWRGHSEVPVSIEAVVECKAGSDHPWMAFYDRSRVTGHRLGHWAHFAHGPFTAITESLDQGGRANRRSIRGRSRAI